MADEVGGICHKYRATVFTLSKTFETAQKKSCTAFFANFCHEIGCENDQTYIFRFVRYLSIISPLKSLMIDQCKQTKHVFAVYR
jgi:hypothetical protein